MRPTKNPQSALRAPLNPILGTEANVRVLRELAAADTPLSRAELAARAGLTLPGASGALAKLRRAGIVEPVGAGSRQSVRLRAEHPLQDALRLLFRAEALRPEALFDDLREAVRHTALPIRAAWIEGAAAERADRPNEPVVLGILAGAREVSAAAAALRSACGAIERRYDVTLQIRPWTEADLATARSEDEHRLRKAISLVGLAPAAYLDAGTSMAPVLASEQPWSSHARVEIRALKVAEKLVILLDRDPSLPRRARSWIVHRSHAASAAERHELDEWLHLLDTASIPRLQYVLLDPGERGTRLRQSNPFLPVLTDAERASVQGFIEGGAGA